MGIDRSSLALFSAAKRLGVDFDSTAMLGRQNFIGDRIADDLKRLFEIHGISVDADEFKSKNHFCEELFKLLGAKTVESFDFSDYQQATHIHDMNQPIPDSFHERYSCVHDGGTLEHIFNIAQGFKNALQMVRLNGHFTQVNIANNYMGHGFWQISPEMIFRAMSAENGYDVKAVFLHERVPGGAWHRVEDPEKVRSRVELCNANPTFILTIAKRIAIKEIFAKTPQQSDYVVEWDGGAKPTPEVTQQHARPLFRKVAGRAKRFVGNILQKPQRNIYEPRHYRQLDEEQVWTGDF